MLDSLPQWKISISELAAYIARRYDEHASEDARVLPQVRTRKRKSSSISSMPSRDAIEARVAQDQDVSYPPHAPDLAEISTLQADDGFISTSANKKRKPRTSLRLEASAPSKFQKGPGTVVYYDSHVQSELKRLVDSLGTARNNLRKGRDACAAAKGFVLPLRRRRRERSLHDPPHDSFRTKSVSSTAQRGAVATTVMNRATVDAAFLMTDDVLDAIQSSCNNAAHQVLRDGNCTTELQEALSKMDTLQRRAECALNLLKMEEQKEIEDNTHAHATDNAGGWGHGTTQYPLYGGLLIKATNIYNKSLPTIVGSLPAHESVPRMTPYLSLTPMVAGIIEVDSGDDSSEVVDIEVGEYTYPRTSVVPVV